MKQYRVAKGSALHYKGKVLEAGTDVTDLNLRHIEDHVTSGHVVVVGTDEPEKKLPNPLSSELTPDGKLQTIKPWTFDPSKLKGKKIDELNVMIREKDAKIEPFEDAAEAVAFLSQDFKAPAKK